MKVAICEDEQYWIELLEATVFEWARERNASLECLKFYEPQALIDRLALCADIDLVFLDILLGEKSISGIGAAKAIRMAGNSIPIIFVTGDVSHALDGYVVGAAGYLSKPADKNRLALFLDRALMQKSNARELRIETESSLKSIKAADISYVEIENHTLTYHTAADSAKERRSLKEALEILGDDDPFVQIHRSYAVAVRKINSIKTTIPYSVTVAKGYSLVELPVSRKHIRQLLDAYSSEVFGQII
ncbi:MAG: LytTR family DNA-binding domain-containing protein [Eubacteriaceae bacterium]|nr:LytTR family DNA-binding domain-containing protein [Eubacteriaceae bacterium]